MFYQGHTSPTDLPILSLTLLLLTCSIESEGGAFRPPDIDLIHHSLATDGEGLVVEPVQQKISSIWEESEARIVGFRILNEDSISVGSELISVHHGILPHQPYH